MVRLSLMSTLLITGFAAVAAQEPEDSDAQDRASAQRLELMRELVQQFSVRPRGDEEDVDLALREEPIMRYNDAARGLVDSLVCRLGETGRPKALVTVELRLQQDRYMASYEFLALETPAIRARFRQLNWEPPQGVADFRPILDGPVPAANARTRLTQMKQLARRFSAHQTLEGMANRLRMLPQPIDRYQPSDDEHADGAAFVFTYGVNPEVLLLIESDGATWTYACGRLSTAELIVELDGESVWEMNPTGRAEFHNSLEPYTQSIQSVAIPAAESD